MTQQRIWEAVVRLSVGNKNVYAHDKIKQSRRKKGNEISRSGRRMILQYDEAVW